MRHSRVDSKREASPYGCSWFPVPRFNPSRTSFTGTTSGSPIQSFGDDELVVKRGVKKFYSGLYRGAVLDLLQGVLGDEEVAV